LEPETRNTHTQNVRVDAQYVQIIEEQKQQIRQLHEELAEFYRVQYGTSPANASRERNVEVIKEGKYDPNRPHKSASSCFLCKRNRLARKQDASKELK
jgi:hypothetical protein